MKHNFVKYTLTNENEMFNMPQNNGHVTLLSILCWVVMFSQTKDIWSINGVWWTLLDSDLSPSQWLFGEFCYCISIFSWCITCLIYKAAWLGKINLWLRSLCPYGDAVLFILQCYFHFNVTLHCSVVLQCYDILHEGYNKG